MSWWQARFHFTVYLVYKILNQLFCRLVWILNLVWVVEDLSATRTVSLPSLNCTVEIFKYCLGFGLWVAHFLGIFLDLWSCFWSTSRVKSVGLWPGALVSPWTWHSSGGQGTVGGVLGCTNDEIHCLESCRYYQFPLKILFKFQVFWTLRGWSRYLCTVSLFRDRQKVFILNYLSA